MTPNITKIITQHKGMLTLKSIIFIIFNNYIIAKASLCSSKTLNFYCKNSFSLLVVFQVNVDSRIKGFQMFFSSLFAGDGRDVRLELVRQLKSNKFCTTAIKSWNV